MQPKIPKNKELVQIWSTTVFVQGLFRIQPAFQSDQNMNSIIFLLIITIYNDIILDQLVNNRKLSCPLGIV